MRKTIEQDLDIKAYNIYGLSEIMGPSVACECREQNGMHVQEDNFIIEILDPKTNEPVPDGELGEVVFTTITKEGLPLIRYKTHDLASIQTEVCACGRTTVRLQSIMGRTDDMLIVKGVNVFPSQIEEVILGSSLANANYQIVADRVNNTDTMEVRVELDEDMIFDEVKKLEGMSNELKDRLKEILGISVKVKLLEPKSLPRSEGKAKRVIDNRKF